MWEDQRPWVEREVAVLRSLVAALHASHCGAPGVDASNEVLGHEQRLLLVTTVRCACHCGASQPMWRMPHFRFKYASMRPCAMSSPNPLPLRPRSLSIRRIPSSMSVTWFDMRGCAGPRDSQTMTQPDMQADVPWHRRRPWQQQYWRTWPQAWWPMLSGARQGPRRMLRMRCREPLHGAEVRHNAVRIPRTDSPVLLGCEVHSWRVYALLSPCWSLAATMANGGLLGLRVAKLKVVLRFLHLLPLGHSRSHRVFPGDGRSRGSGVSCARRRPSCWDT